jgi:hypothetical protein
MRVNRQEAPIRACRSRASEDDLRSARRMPIIGRMTEFYAGRRYTALTGAAGEYYVAAELSRRGWAASITPKGVERNDVLAQHLDTQAVVVMQVKTSAVGRSFRLSEKNERPTSLPTSGTRSFVSAIATSARLSISCPATRLPRTCTSTIGSGSPRLVETGNPTRTRRCGQCVPRTSRLIAKAGTVSSSEPLTCRTSCPSGSTPASAGTRSPMTTLPSWCPNGESRRATSTRSASERGRRPCRCWTRGHARARAWVPGFVEEQHCEQRSRVRLRCGAAEALALDQQQPIARIAPRRDTARARATRSPIMTAAGQRLTRAPGAGDGGAARCGRRATTGSGGTPGRAPLWRGAGALRLLRRRAIVGVGTAPPPHL